MAVSSDTGLVWHAAELRVVEPVSGARTSKQAEACCSKRSSPPEMLQ